jgi:hypothetical protein
MTSRLLVSLLPKHVNGDTAHKYELVIFDVTGVDIINNSSYTKVDIPRNQFRKCIRYDEF